MLFGSDMVDVTTPDGRRITVPQQLAAQFPGLRPATPPEVAQPPALPVAPPPPVFSPADRADLAQRTAPPPDTAAAAPVTSPSQAEPSGSQAPRGPVATPAQATDAGPPNTPAPITNDQLAKMGVAGGVNAELAANESQRAAVKQQGAALANQADKVAATMAASEAEAGRLLEQRRMAAEENARMMQSRTDEYLRNAKAIADTKIDRSVDHPVLAAIGVALGAIGGAMMQKQNGGQLTNPGLDALYKAIDRKAAAQVQDLDLKRQGLATQRDALGMQRQSGIDRLQEMDTYRLGYIEQAKRQVETIKQQTTSDVVRANADVALAGLDQEAAKTVSGAQARWQTQHEAEAARKQTLQIAQMSNATTRRGQDMQQREADLNREERRQEKLDEIATRIALAKGKSGEDQAKLVREAGLSDPRTGDPILTEAGAQKMADADKAEAMARKAGDPAQAAKLNAYAQTLRQSAQMNDVATARDKGDREKVQGTLDAANVFTTLADSTIAKLKAGPSAWNREEWASLKADLATAQARYVATLGERVSVKALEAFQTVTSIDPDDPWWSRTVDKGKAIAALEALKKDAASWSGTSLKGAGIKTKWRPGVDTEETSLKGATANEIARNERPNYASEDANQAIEDQARERALSRTNAKGQVNSYGLDPADNEKLQSLVDQAGADTTGHAKYRDIVKTLANPLTQDRPGLATSVARLIKDRDPRLYADVLSQIDPAKAKEIDSYVSGVSEMPKRTALDLTDEERSQLEQQRRESGMKADRAADADYFRRGQPAPGAR